MINIQLPVAGKKAAVFDMDGTMIENASYHKLAWKRFAQVHGKTLDDTAFYEKVAGRTNMEVLPNLFERSLGSEELTNYGEEKELLYRELYKPYIKEVQGLRVILGLLKEAGFKLGIATSAPKANRDWALEILGLEDIFEVVIGDEHVTHGKPHPEVFLKAAKALHVKPEECIAFEDSLSGIKSAKDAGMYVVALLTSHSQDQLKGFDIAVDHFAQLNIIL